MWVHDLCDELGLRCEVANTTGCAWKNVNLYLLPIRYRLLTNAEPAKHALEQVVRVDRSHHLA